MNWGIAARKTHPNRRILASKIDYKFAYSRCHSNVDAAVQTCIQLPKENLALVALCLTFGGYACSFERQIISETICGLLMALLHIHDWDP